MSGGAVGRTSRRRTFLRLCAGVVLALALRAPCLAEPPARVEQSFDLPAGDAAVVLQAFARDTAVQLIFPVRAVEGVRTNPIHGRFTVAAALDHLLAGTVLEPVYDPRTNSYAVRTRHAPPVAAARVPSPAPEPAPHSSSDVPTQLSPVSVEQRRPFGVATQSILPVDRSAPLYYHIVTREEIEQSGVTNIAEFLTTVPGYSGEGPESLQSTADLNFLNGANIYAGAYLKMRGWDSQHTAVLLNGRRLPTSPESRGPDLSRIPLAAVDRIEVLPFAGSALYGDGAVGGAMDIILKKDLSGSMFTLQLGQSARQKGREVSATWMEGRSFGHGRTKLTVLGDYEYRGILRLGDRTFLSDAMQRLPLSLLIGNGNVGRNLRPLSQAFLIGYPSVFTVMSNTVDLALPNLPGAQFALAPAGQNASQLVPTSFVSGDPGTLAERRQNRLVLRAPTTSYNATVQVEHALIPDRLEAYGEIGYSRADVRFSAPDAIEPLSLSLTDPRSPFRVGNASTYPGRSVLFYFDPLDLPDARLEQYRDSGRIVLGVRGKPLGGWHWSVDNFFDLSHSDSTLDSFGASLNDLIRRWTPANEDLLVTIYDPLADHRSSPISPEMRDRYLARRSTLSYRAMMFGSEFRIGGVLGRLPAGPVRLEAGAEYEWRDNVTTQATTASREFYTFLNALPTYVSATTPVRTVDRGDRVGGLAEAILPLSRDFKPLPLYAGEIDLASRIARTDGGHAAASSLVALKLAPSRSFAVRATFSQGHVTPSSTLVNGPVTNTTSVISVVDPQRGNIQQFYPVEVIQGGSTALRPETSRARVLGVLLTPAALPGLFISIDRWSIRMNDRLREPTAQEVVSYAEYFPGKLVRDYPLPWEQALGWSGAIRTIDLRPVHVTRLEADGIDVSFRYRFAPTRLGTFTLSGQLETVSRYQEQFLPITPLIDKVNILAGTTSSGLMESAVVTPRSRWTVAWQRGRWFASVIGSYSPRYHTDTTTPTPALPNATGVDGEYIGSSTLWNTQLGYTVPPHMAGWLGDTTWTIGARNVFNREPPLRSDGTSFYSRFDDPRLRFIYLRVQWRR